MEELLAYVGAELKRPQEEISDELVFLINSRINPLRNAKMVEIRIMPIKTKSMNVHCPM